jgi:ABC-2 type transport system permease protein
VIILGSSLYNFLWATAVIVVYLVLGGLFFGARLAGANLLSAAVVLVLTVTSFSSLGILSACFILVFKKGDPLGWAIQGLAGLVCGVIYPVEVLPHWLQFVSRLIPVTYALRAMRLAVLQGSSLARMAGDVLALVGFTVVLLPFSLWLFGLSVRKAKRDGTLTQY